MFSSSKIDFQQILSEKFCKPVFVESVHSIGGGCINETAKVKTSAGIFFAKWNDAKKYPGMLETEANGLRLLKGAAAISVPEVITPKTIGNTQYLILEYIDSAVKQKNFWIDFGKSLAKLHKNTSEKFGLDHDNYIGSLPQSNCQHLKWSEFFVLERLEPQIRLARNNKRIGNSILRQFGKLFSQLEKIFPEEKPSLLHGDLWIGNYMIGNKGKPFIIDPAVYFGHREIDLGMTKLFGGFSSEFYESYHEQFPLEKDWQKRTDICNLYPLMVHVNLFGGSYSSQIESTLRRF